MIIRKVPASILDEITDKANSIIARIPDRYEDMTLSEHYFQSFDTSLWLREEYGYYKVLRLFDHAEVRIDYMGSSITDTVNSMVIKQIETYLPLLCARSERPYPELKKEYLAYCNQYVGFEIEKHQHNKSYYVQEIYIPSFLEHYMMELGNRDEQLLLEFKNGAFCQHRMCFDKELGYIYVIPLANGDLFISQIGDNTGNAFLQIMKLCSGLQL